MKKNSSWTFVKNTSRPNLSGAEARKLRGELFKTLKVGIELEYNLPSTEELCKRNDPKCECISKYKLESGVECQNVCNSHGSCELEKSVGCPDQDIFCVEFIPLCVSCNKADKGCSKCAKAWSEDKEPDNIRNRITDILEPTRFLGSPGKSGVLDVVKDHSLSGDDGIEIVTVGQRVSFDKMFTMCNNIVDIAAKNGAYVNERTSIHFHILSGYLSTSKYNPKRPHYGLPGEMAGAAAAPKSQPRQVNRGLQGFQVTWAEQENETPRRDDIEEAYQPLPAADIWTRAKSKADGPFEINDLETPVPEIVLANFHQLWRRYENAFVWLTSTGNNLATLTRWAKFRRSLIGHSADRHNMYTVVDEIRSRMDNNNRYGMVNYGPVKFCRKTGNIKRLHFEIRASDGCLSAASIAAQACLIQAMLLKAVDISRHGVLKSGSEEYMSLAATIGERLCNNHGDWNGPRTSDTSRLDPYINDLMSQATELVTLCKSFLVDDHPAYDVLLGLAKRPISLRRCDGSSWENIERELLPKNREFLYDAKLLEIIDLMVVTECESPRQWLECVSQDNGLSLDNVARDIRAMEDGGAVFWNNIVGSFCRR